MRFRLQTTEKEFEVYWDVRISFKVKVPSLRSLLKRFREKRSNLLCYTQKNVYRKIRIIYIKRLFCRKTMYRFISPLFLSCSFVLIFLFSFTGTRNGCAHVIVELQFLFENFFERKEKLLLCLFQSNKRMEIILFLSFASEFTNIFQWMMSFGDPLICYVIDSVSFKHLPFNFKSDPFVGSFFMIQIFHDCL